MIAVSGDEAFRNALRDAKPGDVVQVKPGTYRGGMHTQLRGEKDHPIIIEATDPANPPVIQGGANGIHISGSQYLTLRRLKFRGGTGNGLNIDDAGKMDFSSHHITLDGVEVEDVGPKGNTDGIKVSGIKDFRFMNCRVEGWGGSAIDFVGCSDGIVERCVFKGKDGFECATGPQAKGGSQRITIRECFFDRAGGRAINAGGSTGLKFFRPLDATFEARELTIENNVFIGSDAPVAFVGIDGSVFRHNTILNPTRWVLRILQENRDERFVRSRNGVFERNLIVYTRASTRSIVNNSDQTQPETFTFKENWWYCADSPNDRPQLPSPEQDGVYGKDPRVKIDGKRVVVGNAEAQKYGAQ